MGYKKFETDFLTTISEKTGDSIGEQDFMKEFEQQENEVEMEGSIMAMVDELNRLHRLVDKLSMSMKARLVERALQGYAGWDSLDSMEVYGKVEKALDQAFNEKEWLNVCNYAAFLWFEDWKNFLGCDFLEVGQGPEYFKGSGI